MAKKIAAGRDKRKIGRYAVQVPLLVYWGLGFTRRQAEIVAEIQGINKIDSDSIDVIFDAPNDQGIRIPEVNHSHSQLPVTAVIQPRYFTPNNLGLLLERSGLSRLMRGGIYQGDYPKSLGVQFDATTEQDRGVLHTVYLHVTPRPQRR